MEKIENIPFTFSDGRKQVLHTNAPFSKLFIHWVNGHKTKAVNFESPAQWLGNAVGEHPKHYSFIQTYCETCKEKFGITYLDKFDIYSGNQEGKLTEEERREEIEIINKFDNLSTNIDKE